jgi:hypothetical protein
VQGLFRNQVSGSIREGGAAFCVADVDAMEKSQLPPPAV